MCVFSTSVTFYCCVFIMCTWFGVHLSLRLGEKHLHSADCIASRSVGSDETGPPRSRRQRVIPLAPAFFPKGQISLRNKAKRAAWKTYHCSQSCS